MAVPDNPDFTDAVEEEIRRKYPHLAFYMDHPELGPILRRATEQGWDQMRLMGAVWNTRWWKTTADTARAWDNLARSDPATARQQRDNQRFNIRQLARQNGFDLPPGAVAFIAEYALRYGWDDAHIRNSISSFVLDRNVNRIGDGAIRNQATQLMNEARAYHLEMTEKQALKYATRMFGGNASAEGWSSMLRRRAAARMPWLRDLIKEGVTPDDYYAPSRAAIANTLGLSVEDVDLRDDRWRKVVDYRDPDTNERRAMTDSEAKRYARQQDQYRHTDEANGVAAEFADAIGTWMGMRG